MTLWSCGEMEAPTQTWPRFSRRALLANVSAFGVGALLGTSRPGAAEAPPEATKIRFVHTPAVCLSLQYLADELLRLEGFSEIEYVDIPTTKTLTLVEEGRADMTERVFMASFVAYVGVNPRDIRWIITSSADEAMQTFIGDKADAFLAFAAQPVELRTMKVGGVILDTARDRPWSQ